jgi:hypothetical protein
MLWVHPQVCTNATWTNDASEIQTSSSGTLQFLTNGQGDQIGRISARWVTVYFWNLALNCMSRPLFGATFSTINISCDKTCVGQHFGRFFLIHIWSPCQWLWRETSSTNLFYFSLKSTSLRRKHKHMVI